MDPFLCNATHDTWSVLPDIPKEMGGARRGASAAVSGGVIYLFG
eukprot:gene7558-5794_t